MSSSRSYRLSVEESVPEGIASVALGRIDHALAELRGETDSSPSQAVHEARKDMKKLRALLRLVRDDLGEKAYRRENAAFRDAGRELAGTRDADVMIATLDGLELPATAAGPLRQAVEAHRLRTAGGGRTAERAVEILLEARERVESWPMTDDSFDALGAGIARGYRRGRRDLRAMRRKPTAEGLHEWRKRVKDLWYHHLLLNALWPKVMDAYGGEAHALADRLGDDHDLHMLHEWTLAHADAPPELVKAVEARRALLQADAFRIARRLYAERPGAFERRLERWWRAVRVSGDGRVPTAT